MSNQDDLADDVMAGTIFKIFFLGPPISPSLLHALSTAAVNMMLKGYEVQEGKTLLDASSSDAAANAASLARVEKLAGRKAASELEEIAIVAAATFRDLFRENPGLPEALKSTDHALDCQDRERAAILEAAKLASKEVVLKDAQTYLEVCDLVANLAARKASDILARRSESLPRRRSSAASGFGKVWKKLFG